MKLRWMPGLGPRTVAFVLLLSGTSQAGIGDASLPLFSDNTPSVAVLRIPGVLNRTGTATVVLCSSIDSQPVHIGVEIFDDAGVLQNDVHAGAGAILNVAPGASATISTSATAAFLESAVLTLSPTFSQGSARVVASSPNVRCNVLVLDDGVTPPSGLSTLGEGVALGSGALPSAIALPQFSDGHNAVASALFPGAVKRGDLETAVFCTSIAAAPVDIGVELLSASGAIANSIAADNGAVLAVAPGETVTFGTTGTAALLETSVVALPSIAQGMARVVSDSTDVLCAAVSLDALSEPAAAMTELSGFGAVLPVAQPSLPFTMPTFSDGSPSVQIATVPGVVKRGQLQTLFLCSSYASAPVDIGVEVYSRHGTLLNNIGQDVGVVLGVNPGATVTIATSATAAYLETTVIPLAAGLQGSARILASSADVACTTVVVDDLATPPATAATISATVTPSAGGAPGLAPLPVFGNGHAATHAAHFPGAVKRGDVETDVFCTSVSFTWIDVGVQVFAPDGTLANDVTAGNGAVLSVPPGATVTIGTTGTAALFESDVISLPGIAQGMARVVSSSGDVVCSAMVLDAGLTPPVSSSSLRGFAASCGDDVVQPGEQCDGSADGACPGLCGLDCRCPASCGDGFVQTGEDCDDGNTAGGDCCSAACTLECGDGNPCTRDFCEPSTGTCTNDGSPVPGCLEAGKSLLQVKQGKTTAKDQMKWIWKSGDNVTLDDLGNPDLTTGYSLCLHDSDAGVGSVATWVTLPPSPLWIVGKRGWSYKDRTAAVGGFSALQLGTGQPGRSKLKLKAGGVNLPMPSPVSGTQFFTQQPEVAVQLFNDETGACWTSSFPLAHINDGLRFKAKAP